MSRTASRLKRAGIGFVSVLFLILAGSAGAAMAASDVPADWIEISAGREFDFMAPPGTKLRPSSGIDSSIGRIDAPKFHLSFEYGLYSNRLADLNRDAKYEARDVLIDGKAATIVTAHAPRLSTDHPFFIGIHVPEIKMTGVGPTKLTMFGLVETADYYPVIEKIFSTIKFK